MRKTKQSKRQQRHQPVRKVRAIADLKVAKITESVVLAVRENARGSGVLLPELTEQEPVEHAPPTNNAVMIDPMTQHALKEMKRVWDERLTELEVQIATEKLVQDEIKKQQPIDTNTLSILQKRSYMPDTNNAFLRGETPHYVTVDETAHGSVEKEEPEMRIDVDEENNPIPHPTMRPQQTNSVLEWMKTSNERIDALSKNIEERHAETNSIFLERAKAHKDHAMQLLALKQQNDALVRQVTHQEQTTQRKISRMENILFGFCAGFATILIFVVRHQMT